MKKPATCKATTAHGTAKAAHGATKAAHGATKQRSCAIARKTSHPPAAKPSKPTRAAGPAKAPSLRVQLGHTTLTQGQLELVVIRAQPNMRITYAVSYDRRPTHAQGTAQADTRGLAHFTFVVAAGPSKGQQVLKGTLHLSATAGRAHATAVVTFTVVPRGAKGSTR